MPAKSQHQQKFMGMVHALQKGELDPEDVSPEVRKVAKTIKKKDAEDFASTKHKGLPAKVKDESCGKKHKVKESMTMGPDEKGKYAVWVWNKDGTGQKYYISKAQYDTGNFPKKLKGKPETADWKKHQAMVKRQQKQAMGEATKWDAAGFHDQDSAQAMAMNKKVRYVPFHELSPSDQKQAVRMYPHKSTGGKYDFRDEHYYYPVKKDGSIARANRFLAIPMKLIKNDKYMAKLGYKVNPSWNEVKETIRAGLRESFAQGDYVKLDVKALEKMHRNTPAFIKLVKQILKRGKGKAYVVAKRGNEVDVAESPMGAVMGTATVPMSVVKEEIRKIVKEVIEEQNALMKAKEIISSIFKRNKGKIGDKEYKEIFSKGFLKTHGDMAVKYAWSDLQKKNQIKQQGKNWVWVGA